MSGYESERDLRPSGLLAAIVAVLISWAALIVIAELSIHGVFRQGLFGDPILYMEIGQQIIDGGVPYTEIAVEHLPSSLLPIVVVAWFYSMVSAPEYIVWGAVMGIVFLTTVMVFDLGPWSSKFTFRFVIVALPTLPLAMERLEVWVVFLTVIALVLWERDHRGAGVATFVATLAKGWPIVLLALGWLKQRRMAVILTGFASFAALLLVWSQPLFRSGREFTGIHSETFVGSAILLARQIRGEPTGLVVSAGAYYVEAGTWAVILNLALGCIVLAGGLRIFLQRKTDTTSTMSMLALLTFGVMIGGPLFSSQFIFWVTPFIAFASFRARSQYIGAAVATLCIILWIEPEALAWSALVVGRNALLAITILTVFTHARSLQMTSDKNRPV